MTPFIRDLGSWFSYKLTPALQQLEKNLKTGQAKIAF